MQLSEFFVLMAEGINFFCESQQESVPEKQEAYVIMSVKEKMTAIADAIRGKTGGTELLSLDAMAEAITGIETGGGGDYTNDQIGALIDKSVTEFTIPDGVTTIGTYVFYDCSSLQTVYFPDGLTKICKNAFSGCKNLQVTELPDSIEILDGFNGVSGCKLTRLPANLKRIESYSLYGSGVAFTEIPAGVEYIGTGAFSYGTNIKIQTLTFLGTPTTIGSSALIPTITTLNVPWAEGEVANAPWGATSATINYNYTGQ